MCKYCDYNSDNNEIFIDSLTQDYYLKVNTYHWDEWNDDWDYERVYINYCPYCGRHLLYGKSK